MRKRRLIGLVAIGALSQSAQIANSAPFTLTAPLAVSMTTVSGCTSIAATALAFPTTVAPNSGTTPQAQGSVTVTCANGVSPILGFNAGSHATGATTIALLKGPGTTGTQTIGYTLFTDSAYSVPFPLVTSQTTSPAGGTTLASTGGPVVVPVFAQVPNVPASIAAGTFTDTITATIYF
jgi:spore coat protein U-like protein